MLTPEQIDSRMAELGDLLFVVMDVPIKMSDARLWPDADKQQIYMDRSRVWERMKDVAEQAKKAREE